MCVILINSIILFIVLNILLNKLFDYKSLTMKNDLTTIEQLEKKVDSKQKIQDVLELYTHFSATNPTDVKALWKIGNLYMLLGAGHSNSKKEKKLNYRKAINYCEKAMMVNENFKKSVDEGNSIVDSIQHLDDQYLHAMGFWYTARFYYFKECLSGVERLLNTKLITDNYFAIARIEEIDENWEGGGNIMSKAIYLISLPEKFGGSKKQAATEFEKAVRVGPNYIVNRWARAKYLHSLTGNNKAFIEDLKWVLNQNPHDAGNLLPWNLYFQKQSRKMLASLGIPH